jgi:hypothetical protein
MQSCLCEPSVKLRSRPLFITALANAGLDLHTTTVVQGCGSKEYNTSAIIITRCSALSTLTKLELYNAVLAGQQFADVLQLGRIALPTLRALILPQLHLDALNAEALSENLCNMTELMRFEVTKASLTTSDFVALAPGIANMPALLFLSFMACCVGHVGARAVGEALATIPAIWQIRMSECKINGVGAQALCHALHESKVCRLFKALDLRGNPIEVFTGRYSFTVNCEKSKLFVGGWRFWLRAAG